MKKRMFAYLMALCMTVTMFSGTVLAEEKESSTECVCTTLCTEDSVNDLCDVCKNDITDCVGGVENTEEPVEPTEEQTEENKQEEENVETQEENIEDETDTVEETEDEKVLVDNQEDIPEDEEQAEVQTFAADGTMLPEAVDGVITLDEDITLSEKWTVSDKVTLDLNGNTLDVSAKGISVKGELTVEDNSANSDGNIQGGNNMISVAKGGSLIIRNGNIKSTNGTAVKLEYAGNNSFTMESGTVSGTATTVNAMAGTVTVTGGEITTSSTSKWSFGIENGYAEAEVIVGEESGNDEDIYISSIGGQANHTVKIYSGTIGNIVKLVSSDSILDGLFEENIDDVLPAGKVCKESGGYYKVVDLTNEEDAEAKIGDTLYSSVARAVGDMKDGDTLILLEDLVGSGSGVLTVKAKNAVIDLNGHSFTDDEAKGVISVKIPYGDAEDCETTIKNSGDKQAVITGKIPLAFSLGDSRYSITVNIEGDILLDSNSGQAIDLGTGAKLAYSEDAADALGNGGFKSIDKDGNAYIYGGFAYAVEDDADKVVELLNDYTGNEPIHSGDNSGTLDLDGHTYTYTGKEQIVNVNYEDTELTIKNGKLKTTSDILNQGGIIVLYNNSSIILDKVQMDVPGDSYGIVTNGTNVNNGVTLRNSTLNVHDGLGIYFPSSGSVTIDNSVINAKHTGVQICAGDLTITGDNTAITVTGNTEKKTEGDGPIVDGAAISIIERTGYKGIGTVTIEGGTFTSAGTDQNGEKIPAVKAYSFNNTDKEQEWAEAGNSVTISGGNYSKVPENMNDLCADGYVPSVKEDGSVTVKPGVDANFAAQVGNRKYKTLEEAINAVGKGGTITLLRNVEEKGIFIPAGDKNFTIDFNNHKFTATELVGSKGTESQVMHLEKGNTVVMKNGTITVKPELYGNTAMLIQNYCNLTLENMILDGTVLDHPDKPLYALSNNCGNTVLKGNTVISAKDGDFAFDVCWAASYTDGARVTMEDGVKINGDVQLGLWGKDAYEGTQSVLTVNGGTITGGLELDPNTNYDEAIETLKPNVTINGGSFGESVDEYLDESDKANAKIEKANGLNAYYTDINEAVKDSKEDDVVVDLTDKKDPETKYYTVTLDYNDDETAKLVLSIKDGDTFTVPEDPSQSGYKFLYWLGSDDEKYYEDDEITVEEDITLKAKWEKKSNGSRFELEETESSGDYVVRVDEGKHGEVTVSPKRADKGDTIKITVEPEEGYEIDKIKAFDEDDEEIKLTEKADNKFTFKMPASDVDVEVSFKEKENKEEDKHVMPFIDVPANIWYRNAVQYVYENGIMSGTSDITFSPDMATTRGMIVTILYRLEGMPKTGTANGFTDVPVGAYYEDAVAWASANNIVSGYGNGLFGPEDKVTREQMAVIIYNYHKAMGKDVSNIEGMRIYEFTDYESISDWAVTAVRYCLNAGIFNGNADGTLNPKGNVTRAELAVIINNLA